MQLRHPLMFFTRPVFPCIKYVCPLTPRVNPSSCLATHPLLLQLLLVGLSRLLACSCFTQVLRASPHSLTQLCLLPSPLYRSTSHLLGQFTAFLRSSLPPEFFVVAYATILSMRRADARPNLCFKLLCNLSRVYSFHPFWSLTPLDKMKEVQKLHDT